MRKAYLFCSILLLLLVSEVAISQTTTFNYTGGVQSYTVPASCTSVLVDVRGAGGGNSPCSTPGYGGRVVCSLAVSSGQVLKVYCGGRGSDYAYTINNGGFNGGAYGYYYGGGGGGASDIRVGGTALGNRVVVGGGGGGAGYYCCSDPGGNGGYPNGGNGQYCSYYWYYYCGSGGTQTGGGAGAAACSYSGTLGNGGASNTCYYYGGGGGGGYYGGGGSYIGGGGGGSSYYGTGTSGVSYSNGYNSGNGQVLITPLFPTVTSVPASLAFGNVTANTTSVPPRFFQMSGSLLSSGGSLTLTPPANFSLSLDGITWGASGGAITYSYSGTTFNNTNVYVRFSPTASTSYSGNIVISGGGLLSAVNIPVTGTGTSACSGTPAGGTAAVSPTSGSSSTLFTLSLTGLTAAGNLFYQWQSGSSSGGPFTNIQGAISSSYSFVGISATTYFRCIVTCGGSGLTGTSSVVSATLSTLASGCTVPNASGGNCCGFYVGSSSYPFVVPGDGGTSINDNTTLSSGTYGDKSATMSCVMHPGGTYNTSIAGGSYNQMGFQMWIDFNANGTFESSEIVGGGGWSAYAPVQHPVITIPSNAPSGVFRLRAMVDYNCCGAPYYPSYPSLPGCPSGSPTQPYYYEVRDYKVIIGVPPCSGTPVAGITASAPTSSCFTFNPNLFTVGETIANSGITYQWQSSTTSPTTGFTNIAGATGQGYVPTISSVGPVYYRQTVSCGASTATTISTSDTMLASPNAITGTLNVCATLTTTLSSTTSGGVWSSSNTSNATVGSNTGVVTGITGGTTATITYTVPTGCFATAVVTVNPNPSAIGGPSVVCPAATITLTDGVTGGAWTSSNTAIATANSSSGVVTGVTGGNAVITYTLPSGCKTSKPITVNTTAPITGTFSICTGFTSTLSNSIAGGTWSSNNTAIASVGSSSGVVTGVSVGTATISYTFPNGCVTTAVVGVVNTPLIYSITGGGSFCAGGTGVHIGVSGFDPGVGYQLMLGGSPVGPPVVATTVPADFGLITTPGIYSVVANYGSPCARTMTGSVSVVVLPTPTVYNVTGGGAYCAGGTGVHIGLNGSNTGINYQLMSGSSTVGAPIAGTTTLLDFGLITSTGTYSVTATNTTTGCTAAMNGAVTVSVNALPTAFTVTGGGAYCAGGAGVPVGLGNSTTGVSYQLYRGGVATGSPVAGATGAAISFGLQTAGGSYTVKGTNTTTGCVATMTGAVTVTVSPLPTAYTVTGGGSYCAGGTGLHVGVGNSDAGITYTLYRAGSSTGVVIAGTGTAIDFGTFTTPGVYTVVATSSAGCVNNMVGSATISTNPVPNVYNVTGGGSYCAGGTGVHIGLNGSNLGVNYFLYNGTGIVGGASGTTAALDFGLETTAGVYTVVAVIPGTGCSSTMTGSATVVINPLPASFSLTGGGAYCAGGTGVSIGLGGSASGTNYVLRAGGVPVSAAVGGTGGAISFGSYTGPGVYTVVGTTAAGCSNAMPGSVAVSVNPTPPLHNVTGGGGYCAGGTGVNIGLNGSDPGISYQLITVGSPVGSAVAGTGTILGFGLQTVSGSYTVTATNTASGCTSTMAGSPSVVINPLPTVFNVTGGGSYCFGGGGAPVGLSGSSAGASYQLYLGSTAIGTSVAGTGALLDFGMRTTAGTYTIAATNTSTGCSATMSGSATVGVSPLPTVYSVTGGGAYCAGGTGVHVGLSNSTSGINYQLYNGTSTVGSAHSGTGMALDFGPLTASGNYTVVATDGSGCNNNMSGSASITINPAPAAFSVTGGGGFCAGGSGVDIGLASSATGVTYQLYNGTGGIGAPLAGTGGALDFGLQTISGTYTITGTSTATGCSGSMASSATVAVNPLPAARAVSGGGNYCVGGSGVNVGMSATDVGITYQLYLGSTAIGSPVSGSGLAVSFGLQTASGTYTVLATNAITGCSSNMSGSAMVTISATPTVYAVTGGGNYCPSTGGALVGLSGSDPGINYQLFNGSAVGAPVIGTGSAISFGLHTTPGSYTVVANGTLLSCTANMSGAALVAIASVPADHNVTGGGSYCSGTAGVPVGLDMGDAGTTYQLYNGATPVGSPVSGSGAAVSFGLQTTAGTYTVKATDGTSGCTTNMIGTASVAVNGLPITYTVTGGGSFCSGGAGVDVQLSGSQLGVSYQLSDGAGTVGGPVPGTGSSLDFGLLPAGVYTVAAMNAGTFCASNMTGTATVTENPGPGLNNVTGGGGFCLGTAGVDIGLSGSSAGVSYQLYNGPTTSGLPIIGAGSAIDFGLRTSGGTYTVKATDVSTGCSAIMSGSAIVAANPLPMTFAVSGSGASYCAGGSGVSVDITGSEVGVNYQLYRGSAAVGGPFTGTGSPFSFGTVTNPGGYIVKATNVATGCSLNMPGGAVISVDPAPTVYDVTGGGAFCSGGTGVHISLSGSSAGIHYQLYKGSAAIGSPLTGTGSSLDMGIFDSAGNYTVVATNPSTGCASNMTGSATVGINPLPAPYGVTGGGAFCAGGTGAGVGLANSVSGIYYQLYRNGLAVGGTTYGSGGPLDFGLQTLAGTYTVIASNPITGCTGGMTGAANVVVNPSPASYMVTGGGGYCTGGTGVHVGLSNGQTGVQYQLYDGSSSAGSPVFGSGAAIDFGLQSTTGVYTVRATDTLTGCAGTMAGSVNVNINAAPAVYSVTGGGHFCFGGAGVHVGLSNSASGVDYTLHSGALSATLHGTGAGVDFGLQNAPGTYTVTATNASTGCTNNMTGVATVSVDSIVAASVAIAGGNQGCTGHMSNFAAVPTNGGTTPGYEWYVNGILASTNSDLFSYMPANGDIVSVSLTSSAACAVPGTASKSVSMNVNNVETPVVAISSDRGAEVCQGTAITVTALPVFGGNAPVYTWYKNGVADTADVSNTYSYSPANGDDIYCMLHTSYYCHIVDTARSNNIHITTDATQTPVVVVTASGGGNVVAGGQEIFTATVSNAGPSPSYQWYVNNSIVPGATLPVFEGKFFNDGDLVTCKVTSDGICAGVVGSGSATVHVWNVSVKQVPNSGGTLSVIPNPNNGTFSIVGFLEPAIDEEFAVEITDMLGRYVYSGSIHSKGGKLNEQISLAPSVANGMYLLSIHSSTAGKVFHIVVER